MQLFRKIAASVPDRMIRASLTIRMILAFLLRLPAPALIPVSFLASPENPLIAFPVNSSRHRVTSKMIAIRKYESLVDDITCSTIAGNMP